MNIDNEMSELEAIKRAIEALADKIEVHETARDDSAADSDWHAIQALLRLAHSRNEDLSYSLDDWAFEKAKEAIHRGIKQYGQSEESRI